MGTVNEIVICKSNYATERDFQDALRDAVMLLLNNDYILTIRNDEKGLGIFVINFDSDDLSFGGLYPYWMTNEQYVNMIKE